MRPILTLLLAFFLAALTYILVTLGHRSKHLPAGPSTLPIIGNIHQIPKKGAHFQFTKWAKQYGGIYSLKLGTGTAVVLTSRRLVKELVEKKSAVYSERPRSWVANFISGGDHILLMAYSPQWRATRKLLHCRLMEKVVESDYVPLIEAEGRQMLRDYLVRPEEHMLHPKRFSNSVTMSIVWGVRTPETGTRHMRRLYDLMEVWSKVMEPGATPPVDIYPLLHHLPERIFNNWISRATHVRNEMNGLYADFLSDLRMRRRKEGSRGSFMDRVLDEADGEAKRSDGLTYRDHELWFMGGTMTEGGSDTTASILTAFVQAMVTHPEIQKRAQRDIDAVIGTDRSPVWSDYASLPYIAQIVKETMRWRPVTPLAFPHALTEDDWVDGMFLPAGTTIIINAWGLHFDPARFGPDAHQFDPDHFAGVTTSAADLANGAYSKRDHYGYGAGRRFCPGVHIAERNLFVAMAKLLWGFEMRAGEGGVDVDPATGYHEGFLVCARDFGAGFEVRGRERRETILKEWGEVEGSVFGRFGVMGGERA